ncbi:MAG: hypothetical protein AAGG44_04040, partial [Planctomycetota bacterium]
MKVQALVLSSLLLSANIAVADVPEKLIRILESRESKYPNVSIKWASKHFRNTTIWKDDTSDPFGTASSAEKAAASASQPGLVELTSEPNWCFIKNSDMSFRHSGLAQNKAVFQLFRQEYSCVNGDLFLHHPAQASAIMRPGLGVLDVSGFGFEPIALNFRPPHSRFFRDLKSGRYKRMPGTKTWAGRTAIAFLYRANGNFQLWHYFDAQVDGVYLGLSQEGVTAKVRLEVFPKFLKSGEIELTSITKTVLDT